MKIYVLFFLVTGMSLLISSDIFSQTTGNNSPKLFNEGGYVRGITHARAIGLVELGLGLSSLIVALRAKKRSAKRGAKTALALGLGAVVFSAIHFFLTIGAIFGSGSGKAGAIIAFVLGLTGTIIALLTLRSLKTNEH